MLVDSHCHLDRLDLKPYEGKLEKALVSARERGISAMLCVCIDEENKDVVVDIARSNKGVFASVGIHPCDVKETFLTTDQLKAWVNDDKIVAIGETGLDYYYSRDFEDQQKQSFTAHLTAAGDLGLPVIVHTRHAREDTIDLIRAHGNTSSAGVLHCFTESLDMAKQALDLNYYISLSGIVTFKKAEELREVARYVPMDRLLVETDSPYLAPVPYRGKSNEPKYVREVAEFLAELKGMSYEEFSDQTSANFYRLFSRASGEVLA